jgi:hypothetical protein
MHSSMSQFCARLAESPTFGATLLGACALAGALGAGLLAGVIGVGWSIAIASVAAVVGMHFAFRTFESQIFTVLLSVVTFMFASYSPWFVAILGVVAGLTGGVAILRVMDRPNEVAAGEEARRKQQDGA